MSEREQDKHETDEGWEHWDHLLPDDEWAGVVVEAERIYQERVAEESSSRRGAGPPGLKPKRVSFKDTHGKNSGSVTRRQLYVIHTAESPLKVGYAESLTTWGNGGYQPRASWQKFIDPATVVSWIPLTRAAWHAAPANRLSVGYEQSGYAKYTRDQWLTSDGRRQIDLLAQEIVKDGLPASGLRWLTDSQVKAVIEGRETKTYGLCTHAQVVKAGKQLGKSLAGRTDPGAGYPQDVLLDWVKHYHSGGTAPPQLLEEATMITAVLRPGDSGAQVRLLQTMLNGLRGAQLAVDGKFGPATEAAVVAAHKAWGVGAPHDVVGPGLRAKLNAEWERRDAPKTTVVAQPATPAQPAVTIANIKSAVREVLKEEGLIT